MVHVGGVGAVVYVVRYTCCAVCGRCRRSSGSAYAGSVCVLAYVNGVGVVVGGVGAVVYWCGVVAEVDVCAVSVLCTWCGLGAVLCMGGAGAMVY